VRQIKHVDELPRDDAMGPRGASSLEEPLRESFGRQLRSLRLSRGLSIRRLAKLARIDASYLSRIEHGRLLPPQSSAIARLAVILQIDQDDLNVFARRLPGDVSSNIFRRPRLMMRLVRAAGQYGDDEVDRICRALERTGLLP
jgi:transcriptional regulator with XRE-family HTH domain